MSKLQKKRVYDTAETSDGYRVLVDKLWPRGVKKEELPYDLWAKEITPSNKIRKDFNHKKENFPAFKTSYLHELTENKQAEDFIETVREQLKEKNVTLLYAAKDTEVNHVVVLIEWLNDQLENG